MASRADRLSKFFDLVLSGNRPITSADAFTRFLESVLEKTDHAACVERILASPAARTAIYAGVRFDVKADFLNTHTSVFLLFLSDPSVKKLCNGQFLQDILELVAEPRTVWDAYMQAFQAERLTEPSMQAFAWLLTELLVHPQIPQNEVVSSAQKVVVHGSLLRAASPNTRAYGHKLAQILNLRKGNTIIQNSDFVPGGRHDNDHADFREIAIYPTYDEFRSTQKPFYRRAEEIEELPVEARPAAHLDNQFRLLREDMLTEIREEIQIASGTKKRKRRSASLFTKLSLAGVFHETDTHGFPCALVISCSQGLEALTKLDREARKKLLKGDSSYLRHQSFGCLLHGQEIISFATLDRQIDYLLDDPPKIILRVVEDGALRKTLSYFKLYDDITFLLVDASVFAYEPILRRLQSKADLPLADELLAYRQGSGVARCDIIPATFIDSLRCSTKLQSVLNTKDPINLDPSQRQSLLAGLTQAVSLIQGPPGTGKSFVGALMAKVLNDHSKETILVMCYTNHALDQFLEDLMDIGIDSTTIVRLGSKSSQRTDSLKLSAQTPNFSRKPASWRIINDLKEKADDIRSDLETAFEAYLNFRLNHAALLEFLEFEEPEFFEAFTPPPQVDGMVLVGEGGKEVTSKYLYDRWFLGKYHSMSSLAHLGEKARQVWTMSKKDRNEKIGAWIEKLLEEQVANVQSLMSRLDVCQERLIEMFREKTRDILRSKRIIGCTTTAAAMYAKDLATASPGIVLLEEAGEILEPHILTAIGSHTKQLIMIGDHKQLRPKINNYALSVEKGAGYDLNKSLFERLVESGYPHSTLAKQHRMAPEISSFVRNLTYPDLLDGDKTLNRPAPRGLRNRVVFIDHTQPEENMNGVSDKRDDASKGSKRNAYEAKLVLKIVRYLGQQGYGTDKLVVLTPYLGQLLLLRDELRNETDPVLNDLDSYDLVRAGLISQASAQHTKRPIKLSTIDNYQGEESDIVIATLTRSNNEGDIGFMIAPQRLNVLISRARDVLIMIGNSKTFISSRKGEHVWKPFVDQLQKSGQLYDGLPVKCEQHPQRTAVLETPHDFDKLCPDGGCDQPCGTKLNCGIHDCPHKCHQLSDHSKMECRKVVQWTCSRNHKAKRPCYKKNQACYICDQEDKEQERRQKRDLELAARSEAKQREYARQLAEIQDELAHERRLQKENRDDQDRQRILQQQSQDLARLRMRTDQGSVRLFGDENTSSALSQQNTPGNDSRTRKPPVTSTPLQGTPATSTPADVTSDDGVKNALSSAEQDWQYQKDFEGARSEELDKLISMIGLESIKAKFLNIKSQVDAALRQNVDLKGERFGSVLLGNPGTGKTTVARLYAKFLTSMGIIPGSFVKETTGSRLANGGVAGCEKQINEILSSGGGVLFIDEAYQLVQGGMGSQVLDFLLAEVENLTGKVVVVLAGYRRQMEKFFSHNPGLSSRFPREFVFEDYNERELRAILEYQVNKRFSGRMKAEGGMSGLYCRIVARRIARQRGNEGFGNARTVENVLSTILQHQAKRLARERKQKTSPDDLLLTKEDLIGPEPDKALQACGAWKKLQNMIGLASVKDTVRALLDSIQANYERELQEEPLVEFTLNRVFLGSPGTGKTTVAKLYGEILVDIGYLSNGEVIVKNPADFVGSALGQSEQNTKGILASTVGKVLVIDEAYGLFGGGSRNSGAAQADPYKTAVVDTIVAEVQSNPGDDRCVLLLGYQDQMTEMFQKVNPGLSRRFPLDSAFNFEDFSDIELAQIFDLKLKQQGFKTSARGRKAAMEVLARAGNRPNFGNAGEIDILLNGAKVRQQQRRSKLDRSASRNVYEPQDFDPEYDRGERTETNIPMLFKDIVGCEAVIQKLEGYRRTVKNMRDLDMDPKEQVPFNFLFRGPPGTGKTSTARKMGKVYYDMGLLSSAAVIESSATDLVGQYVGQTGPKTQDLLEKSLGKILLIDEAYRLAEGPFAKEAMDEIVDCITKPKFFQKLIIILAGYDQDINRLMAINPGLTSRFPEELEFKSLLPDDCIKLLTTLMQAKKSDLSSKVNSFDLGALENSSPTFSNEMIHRFSHLIQTANWANARDIQTLGKAIFGTALQSMQNKEITISEDLVLSKIDHMLSERTSRAAEQSPPTKTNPMLDLLQSQTLKRQPVRPVLSTSSVIKEEVTLQQDEAPTTPETSQNTVQRDQGVSDATWAQLQEDKNAAEIAEKEYQSLLNEERTVQNEIAQLPPVPENNPDDDDDEAKRRHEQRRLAELAKRAKLEELRRKREAEEKARRQEQKIQQKLRHMGVCPVGYAWIKQGGGYICAGGSHFISNGQLGI
ncbi:P-loop containing nucleoside triphosphate hydrolase protein [Aspergillus venezuelensis]